MLPVLLFNNCSCSLRVGVRAFRVGGKGLGSVFIFLVVLVWVWPGRFRGVRVGSLEWALWLAAVCLRIFVLGSAAGSRCLFLGE